MTHDDWLEQSAKYMGDVFDATDVECRQFIKYILAIRPAPAAVEAAVDALLEVEYEEGSEAEEAIAARAALLALYREPVGESLQQRIDELSSGPYKVRSCRGHWHITSGGEDIVNEYGDALDEATARRGAANMNADLHVQLLQKSDKIKELELQVEELKMLLEKSKWTLEEDL